YAEMTDEGRDIMDRIMPSQASTLNRALSGLTTEEKEQAISLLKKLGIQAERLCSNKASQ
ncbi:MarR family transcriptional regulator, partial [Paenibacillus marinisediminis]